MSAIPLQKPVVQTRILSAGNPVLSGRNWLVAAVLIDLFGMVSLIGCSLGANRDCGCNFQINNPFRLATQLSSSIYLAVAVLTIARSIANRQNANPGRIGVCLVGIVISMATLGQIDWLSLPTTVPFWGLLPVLLTAQLLAGTRPADSTRLLSFFASCVVLLALWGKHGDLDLIRWFDQTWQGLDAGAGRVTSDLIPGMTWGDVACCLLFGYLLVVSLPCLIAKRALAMTPADLGLKVDRRFRTPILVWSAIYLAVGLPVFFVAASDPALQSHYPYVRQFGGWGDFLRFEFSMLLFYASVEFFFRGYILFGVERILKGSFSDRSPIWLSAIAVLASAIPYIIWHLDKPQPELLGALLWSVVAGVSAVWFRSVIHLILVHWIWNVWLDWWVIQDLGIVIG